MDTLSTCMCTRSHVLGFNLCRWRDVKVEDIEWHTERGASIWDLDPLD